MLYYLTLRPYVPSGAITTDDDDDYLTLRQYINTACKLYYKVHGLHCKYDCKSLLLRLLAPGHPEPN